MINEETEDFKRMHIESVNRIKKLEIEMDVLINENFDKLTYQEECIHDTFNLMCVFLNNYFSFLYNISHNCSKQEFNSILKKQINCIKQTIMEIRNDRK